MFSSLPQKGPIKGGNIVVLSITLFVVSFCNARSWKSGDNSERAEKSKLHESLVGRTIHHLDIQDQQLHLKRMPVGQTTEPQRILNQADPQQTQKELRKEHLPNQMFSKIQSHKISEFRSKRAVFDILPEGAQLSRRGLRIQLLEGKNDQFSRKKQQQEKIKSLLKKYLKTFVSKKWQKRKKYSSVRMCRFTFMKICQRMAKVLT